MQKIKLERFAQVVRQGLLTGETTDDIARRLTGRLQRSGDIQLEFGQTCKICKANTACRWSSDNGSNHQVLTLVRTSINQVANAASQQVYEANQDITKKYRYVATLDTRTSAICRALDGREFEYGKGPKPPQHFNCRSTTVAVIDYDNLPYDPPSRSERAAQGGGSSRSKLWAMVS